MKEKPRHVTMKDKELTLLGDELKIDEAAPDFFLFDKDRNLAYRGQMDDSRPGNNIPITGKDLRASLNAVLKGKDTPRLTRSQVLVVISSGRRETNRNIDNGYANIIHKILKGL